MSFKFSELLLRHGGKALAWAHFVSDHFQHEYAFARQKTLSFPFTLSDISRAQLFVVRYCASGPPKKTRQEKKSISTECHVILVFNSSATLFANAIHFSTSFAFYLFIRISISFFICSLTIHKNLRHLFAAFSSPIRLRHCISYPCCVFFVCVLCLIASFVASFLCSFLFCWLFCHRANRALLFCCGKYWIQTSKGRFFRNLSSETISSQQFWYDINSLDDMNSNQIIQLTFIKNLTTIWKMLSKKLEHIQASFHK